MRRLLGALLAAVAMAAAGAVPAAARPHEVQECGLLILSCPSAPPSPARPAPTPPPEPFALPPVAAPALPPTATQVPAPPTAPVVTPTPSASAGSAIRIIVTPSPSPTPVTVGNDRNVAIPAIQPVSTGSSLDGGGLLIRLFVVLALLAAGSVASMFALR